MVLLLVAYGFCFWFVRKYAASYEGPSTVNMFAYINRAAFTNQIFTMGAYICGSAPVKVIAMSSVQEYLYVATATFLNFAIVISEASWGVIFIKNMTKEQIVQLLLTWTSYCAASVTRALDSALPDGLSPEKANIGIFITFGIASSIILVLVVLTAGHTNRVRAGRLLMCWPA